MLAITRVMVTHSSVGFLSESRRLWLIDGDDGICGGHEALICIWRPAPDWRFSQKCRSAPRANQAVICARVKYANELMG